MSPRSPSPPLIKGIDGIVSRPPIEVNYSTLNGKSTETRKQPGNEIRRKSSTYGISGNMAKDVKEWKNIGKTGNLVELDNGNEHEMIKNNIEYDEVGVRKDTQNGSNGEAAEAQAKSEK